MTLPPGLVRLFSKRTARSSVEYFLNPAIDQETEIIRAELAMLAYLSVLGRVEPCPRSLHRWKLGEHYAFGATLALKAFDRSVDRQ